MKAPFQKTAEAYFRTLRTKCILIRVYPFIIQGDIFVYHALFQRKRGRTIKTVRIRKDGVIMN